MLLKHRLSSKRVTRSVKHRPEKIACSPGCLSLHQLAQSLGNAVDARDSLTFNHSEEVARGSEYLARMMGLPSSEIEMIHIAAHLHDIGKIGIPDAILKKPGPLTAEEKLLLQQHPEIGAKIVKPVAAFCAPDGVADIILHHHERYDGNGYPSGLKAGNIPIGARIVAVADTLSALMQNRHYRNGTSFDKAVEEITTCNGSQFDPAVVRLLIQHNRNIRQLMNQLVDMPITLIPALQPGFEVSQVFSHQADIIGS